MSFHATEDVIVECLPNCQKSYLLPTVTDGSKNTKTFSSVDDQESMMVIGRFLLQPTSSIPLDLINKAAAEVDPKGSADAEPRATPFAIPESEALQWSPSCQLILTEWVNRHYQKVRLSIALRSTQLNVIQINDDSPESNIVNRPKVKRTGGHVHKLLGRQTYVLPRSSSSVYCVIPLGTTGNPTIEVKEPDNQTTQVPWAKGSLLYLAGDCKLVCDGDGTALGILLAMSYE
jgi:hypothetical protein